MHPQTHMSAPPPKPGPPFRDDLACVRTSCWQQLVVITENLWAMGGLSSNGPLRRHSSAAFLVFLAVQCANLIIIASPTASAQIKAWCGVRHDCIASRANWTADEAAIARLQSTCAHRDTASHTVQAARNNRLPSVPSRMQLALCTCLVHLLAFLASTWSPWIECQFCSGLWSHGLVLQVVAWAQPRGRWLG